VKWNGGKSISTQLVEELQAKQIDVLIIDPFVSCHSVSENDNNAIDMVAKEWSRIADKCDCAVELVHHTRKGYGTGAYDVADGRGASALLNAIRSARVLNEMDEKTAEKFDVDNHYLYFHAMVGKANLAVRNWKATWFHLESKMLPNKVDEIGVPVRWKPQSEGVPPADMDAIAEKIGDFPIHRLDSRSKHWVGKVIIEHLGWEDSAQVRKEVARLLSDWIKCGLLKTADGEDEHRKPRKYVVRGNQRLPTAKELRGE
jgi:hypothetical protein